MGGGIEKVYDHITSGTVYSLRVFDILGRFREDLKIDFVDSEYSCRARRLGVDIYRINDIVLLQEFGSMQKRIVGWYSMGYSPLRLFFQTRNRIIVSKEYKNIRFAYLTPSLLLYAKQILKIVLFEDKKIKKLKAVFLGMLCGRFPKSKFDEWIINKQIYK